MKVALTASYIKCYINANVFLFAILVNNFNRKKSLKPSVVNMRSMLMTQRFISILIVRWIIPMTSNL